MIKHETIVPCIPIFMGFGILLQLGGLMDPAHVIAALLILCIALLTIGGEFVRSAALFLCIMALCIGLGSVALYYRVSLLEHAKISSEIFVPELRGRVVHVRHFPNRTQIIVGEIKQFASEANIKNVRVTSTYRLSVELDVGDLVSIGLVRLQPIPRPVSIDGYDFSQAAYFQQLSSVGFFTGSVGVIQHADIFNRTIGAMRRSIKRYIQGGMSTESAALLVAITTGDKSLLGDDIMNAVRNSGLAHMMAVSGFHMAVLCGMIFAVVQTALLIILLLIKRETWVVYQGRIAAIFTVAVGLLYLILVDMPVSAKRAYLMLAAFLLSVILGRLSCGRYNLSVAASFILLLSPESLLLPSFQMSFMATLAIVALQARLSNESRHNVPGRQRRNIFIFTRVLESIKSTALFSFFANMAIMPFSVYYFNSFATLGALANIVAAPIVAGVIAPLFLLSVITSPLAIVGGNILLLADLALRAVQWVAFYVSNLPLAVMGVPQIPFISMVLFTLCVISFSGRSSNIRLIGIPILFLGVAFALANPPADIFVGLTKGGKVFVAYGDGPNLISSGRKNFMAKEWAAQRGLATLKTHNKSKIDIGDMQIVVSDKVSILRDNVLRHVIDKRDLESFGTHQIWRKDDALIVKNVAQINRPWLAAPK